MVSEAWFYDDLIGELNVLILVLVEDGLRVNKRPNKIETRSRGVLILVLVEDGLRVLEEVVERAKVTRVLILVLVEDGLRVIQLVP